jgi:uncharacterized protein YbbC (DUF1343 family)
MSIENYEGFTKYVYTACNDVHSRLTSKNVVQNIDTRTVIANLIEDLNSFLTSKNFHDIEEWIKKTIPQLQLLLKNEKNQKQQAALKNLINKIKTS